MGDQVQGFDFSEFSQLIDKIEAMGLDEDEVSEAVLEAGSEPARQAFERNVPRSKLDKEHAQDNVKVSKTRTSRKSKNKYRLIGASGESEVSFKRKKRNSSGSYTEKNDQFTYLYFVEYGTTYAPPHPFIEKAYRDAHAAAADPMSEALAQKIEEKLR